MRVFPAASLAMAFASAFAMAFASELGCAREPREVPGGAIRVEAAASAQRAAAAVDVAPAAATERPSASAARPVNDANDGRCPRAVPSTELGPGVSLERIGASMEPAVDVGDRCITLVRIDPARARLRLLNATSAGLRRRADQWLVDFKLAGVINASMFHPGGKSVGLMINGAHVNQPRQDAKLGGFLAFEPTRPGLPPAAAFGSDCAAFDLARIRRDYRVVIQNYRLLDCAGHAIRWKDEKTYSAAAVGLGRDGAVVFIHSRTPYSMSEFATMLASPALGLASAMFVEGGPEASLVVRAGGREVLEIGSYESGFRPDDTNHELWELPNVIGFSITGPSTGSDASSPQ